MKAMSIAELTALREAMQPKMAVRRGLALIEKDGFRRPFSFNASSE